MAVEAGGVDVVIGLKSASFTAGMKEIKRGLSGLDGETKKFHSSMATGSQAAAGSIRLLENPLGNNLRALEKLLSQSKLLSGVFQAAFPLVGAVAMGSILFKLGSEVAAFIKKTQEMPRNLELGFRAMNQSAQLADDMLKVTNDKLDEQIAKLEHKPVNGMALALDEARVNADRLAESLAKDSKAMTELMKENQNGFFATQFMGKGDTKGVSNAINLFNKKMEDLGNDNADALHVGDKTKSDALVAQMTALKNAEQTRLRGEIALRSGKVNYVDPETAQTTQLDYGQVNGDQTSNLSMERRALNQLNLRDDMATDQKSNVTKTGTVASLESQKALATKAAELAKQQAADMMRVLESQAEVAKQWREYHEKNDKIMNDDMNEKFKSNGLSSDDNDSINRSGSADLARITAMRQGLDLTKQNSDALAEFSIQMAVATGQMTKMGAAQATAALHQQQFTDAMKALKDQSAYIATDKQYDLNPTARVAAQLANTNQQNALTFNHGLQAQQDNVAANGSDTSGLVGATDALNEFVLSTRDAAKQVGEFTTTAITGFNDVLLKTLTTHQTGTQTHAAFANYGAGLFRSVASTGLNKAEGSVLGMIPGLGKQGTRGNPMFVQVVNGISSTASAAGGLLSKVSGGSSNSAGTGFMGVVGGLLKSIIPGFADGSPGSISGPAIVGERGPELFIPSGTGNVIPNHKLSSSGGGDIHFHPGAIDARGSTDPAQVEAAAERAVRRAAPSIMAGSVHAMQNHQQRRAPR